MVHEEEAGGQGSIMFGIQTSVWEGNNVLDIVWVFFLSCEIALVIFA